MPAPSVLVYYAWSRPAECGAPLAVLEDRFAALFEQRRSAYPRLESLADAARFDQGIAGFLDHVQKRNFAEFVALAGALRGGAREVERVDDAGREHRLDALLDGDVDTLVVISFDSLRTEQSPTAGEIAALKSFVDRPGNVAFVCPHHDIAFDEPPGPATDDADLARRAALHRHHGDPNIPSRQGFGGYARGLLDGIGLPVRNRHGLRPAMDADGQPAPIEAETALDRHGLLTDVPWFNQHLHLPHLERLPDAIPRMDVLARQRIDPNAPPHPFARERPTFDALLQSRADAYGGTVLVSDTTLFSSTAGGVDALRRMWTNLLSRP